MAFHKKKKEQEERSSLSVSITDEYKKKERK
jgi:hypothetical protein